MYVLHDCETVGLYGRAAQKWHIFSSLLYHQFVFTLLSYLSIHWLPPQCPRVTRKGCEIFTLLHIYYVYSKRISINPMSRVIRGTQNLYWKILSHATDDKFSPNDQEARQGRREIAKAFDLDNFLSSSSRSTYSLWPPISSFSILLVRFCARYLSVSPWTDNGVWDAVCSTPYFYSPLIWLILLCSGYGDYKLYIHTKTLHIQVMYSCYYKNSSSI